MKKKSAELDKIAEIYAIARRREQASIDFYRESAARVESAAEKKFLLDLADLELDHLQVIKDKYEDVRRQILEKRRSATKPEAGP